MSPPRCASFSRVRGVLAVGCWRSGSAELVDAESLVKIDPWPARRDPDGLMPAVALQWPTHPLNGAMTGMVIIFSEGGACALARLGSCAASEIETSASQLRHGDAEIKSTRGSSGAHLSDIAILAVDVTRSAVPSWVRVHLVSCRCLDEAWVSPSLFRNCKLGGCLAALLQGRTRATRDAEDAKPPITSSSGQGQVANSHCSNRCLRHIRGFRDTSYNTSATESRIEQNTAPSTNCSDRVHLTVPP